MTTSEDLRKNMREASDSAELYSACCEALDALDAANATIQRLQSDLDGALDRLTNEKAQRLGAEAEARVFGEQLQRLQSSPAPVADGPTDEEIDAIQEGWDGIDQDSPHHEFVIHEHGIRAGFALAMSRRPAPVVMLGDSVASWHNHDGTTTWVQGGKVVPAPVGGGVPEPLAWMHRRTLQSGTVYSFVHATDEYVKDETARHGGESIPLYSRLPALKPGEVDALEKVATCAQDFHDRHINLSKTRDSFNHFLSDCRLEFALKHLRALRAQATTNEGGAENG